MGKKVHSDICLVWAVLVVFPVHDILAPFPMSVAWLHDRHLFRQWLEPVASRLASAFLPVPSVQVL